MLLARHQSECSEYVLILEGLSTANVPWLAINVGELTSERQLRVNAKARTVCFREGGMAADRLMAVLSAVQEPENCASPRALVRTVNDERGSLLHQRPSA